MRRMQLLILIGFCLLLSCENGVQNSNVESVDNTTEAAIETMSIPSWLQGIWYQEGTNSKSETFTRFVFTNNTAIYESGIDSKTIASIDLTYKSIEKEINDKTFKIILNEENSYLSPLVTPHISINSSRN